MRFSNRVAVSVRVEVHAEREQSVASDLVLVQADLPGRITKGAAFPNFAFLMVLSTDHVTAGTGKTVAGTISKDGAAFGALTNAVAEISAGMYKVNLTATEMDADQVTLRFTNADCDDRLVTIITQNT